MVKEYYSLAMEIQRKVIEAGQFMTIEYHAHKHGDFYGDNHPFFIFCLYGNQNGDVIITLDSEASDAMNRKEYERAIEFIRRHQ